MIFTNHKPTVKIPPGFRSVLFSGGILNRQKLILPQGAEIYLHRDHKTGRVYEYELVGQVGKFLREVPNACSA